MRYLTTALTVLTLAAAAYAGATLQNDGSVQLGDHTHQVWAENPTNQGLFLQGNAAPGPGNGPWQFSVTGSGQTLTQTVTGGPNRTWLWNANLMGYVHGMHLLKFWSMGLPEKGVVEFQLSMGADGQLTYDADSSDDVLGIGYWGYTPAYPN